VGGEVSRGEDDDDSSVYEECNQFSNDEDISKLTSNDIATVRVAIVAGTTSLSTSVVSMLDVAPTTIDDRHFSVLGDSFHFMDIPKVPMHHDGKKGYFVALRQAWFQWDLIKLSDVKAILHEERGVNNAAIEAMLYYDVDYFCVRVPCIVLPPSLLYWQVCAVYEMYGPMLNSKTKAPLLNKAAWKKANSVL
jgi:hypothetical protein